MKTRLTITVGISGSGKSTWSHEQWLKDPDGVVIVNRDKIRELLFGFSEATIKDYYHMDNLFSMEKMVTRYEDTLINEALQSGKDVIVDATHLKRKYLERFLYWNVTVSLQTFSIDLYAAMYRDMNRDRQVGEVIIKMQLETLKNLEKELVRDPLDFTPTTITNNKKLSPCVIFDIDGTIAQMDGKRSPYEWKKVRGDSVEYSTKYIQDCLTDCIESPQVIICTGRDGVALFETKRWLKDNYIDYDKIYIRDEGDSRADWVVKEEMWRSIAEKHYIVGMFDDRLQVVRRARALGLKVFNVEYNNF